MSRYKYAGWPVEIHIQNYKPFFCVNENEAQIGYLEKMKCVFFLLFKVYLFFQLFSTSRNFDIIDKGFMIPQGYSF